MTIYEYITKNLPNLNWNILPQIFEREGVELTEDIEKYLRETPGNTNSAILKNFGLNMERSGEEKEPDVLIVQFGIDFEELDSDNSRVIEVFNYCLRHSIEHENQIICKALKILSVDGESVVLDSEKRPGILKTNPYNEKYWDFDTGPDNITISESGDIERYEKE